MGVDTSPRLLLNFIEARTRLRLFASGRPAPLPALTERHQHLSCRRRMNCCAIANFWKHLAAGLFFCAIIVAPTTATAWVGKTEGLVVLPLRDGSDIRFTHVTSAEGQPHSRVAEITQDDFGFLWFTTQDSIQRFDGYKFKEFRHDPKNPNSPSGSDSLTMFKSRSGKLWIGADQYLDLYDPVTETFTHYKSSSKGGGLFEGEPFQVNEDRENRIWIATDFGLIQLEPATGRTTTYRSRADDPTALSSDRVRATFEDKNGTFWVATAGGIDILDRSSGKVTEHIPLPADFPRPGPVNPYLFSTFRQDHTGTIWVSFSYGYGLARVDRAAKKLVFYSLNGVGTDNDLHSGVRAIEEDEDGNLWLGTSSSGVIKMDRDRKQLTRYRNNPSDPDSLSSDQVNTLFEDREGNIWVGTTGGWVNRFSHGPPPFHRYRHEIGNPNSLDSNYTSAVFEDSTGALWVGSMKVLTRIDRKSGRFTFYRTAGGAGNLSSTWVISIAEDKAGNLWFGTIGGGLNKLDHATGKFTAYRHNASDPHSLSHDTVLSVFVDHRGSVWAGTEDGLNRFDAGTQEFEVYRSNSARENRYRAIAEDFEGGLWLGTLSSGLHYLNPVTGRTAIYRHSPDPKSLSNDQVHAVCVDFGGSIWVATASGLSRLNPETKTFVNFDSHDGLANDDVNSVVQDEHGDLWMGTNDGLSRLNARTKTFRNYSVSDGLVGNEFYNYASAYKSPRGEMFFNNYAGVISFFPDDVIDNPYVPPVVLTDFELFSKPVRVGDKSPLTQSIAVTRALELTHQQSIFSLEFAALSFANPDRNRYRYKLEGLETNWIETDSSRRFVTYTTLPPGDYVFRVQGSNNRGVWNLDGVALHIRVLPPWWRTWWFRTLATVFVLGMAWLVYFGRVRSINRRNRELTQLNEELRRSQCELEESESKLAEAQHVAHVGHYDFDLDRGQIIWSEELYCIYGLRRDIGEIKLELICSLIPEEEQGILTRVMEEVHQGKSELRYEHRIIRPDGEMRHLDIRTSVSKGENGKPAHIFGTVQDITERKQAEEEIRRLNAELEERVTRRTAELTAANKELEAFTSSVSHDLRAPLRHIAAFSKILMDEYLAQFPEDARHLLERIAKQTQRMGQLVDDLLNLSRVGRQELRFHPVNLRDIAHEVIEELSQEQSGRVVEWKVGPLPTVLGDALLIAQVFQNLLSNAHKFTRPRATAVIEIGEMVRDGVRVIFIKDNGVGFDMRYVDKLFGVFQRLHRADAFEGTGVGLATVQRIIQKHGGKIWAESVLDQGATFFFSFGTYVTEPANQNIVEASRV